MKINDNEIHLWFVYDEQIDSQDLLVQYYDLLNGLESEKQQRFHFAKHRHQYLLTRATVRSVLSKYNPTIAAEDWVFEYNDYGKPHVSNNNLVNPISFNISHTDRLVVMAVTSGQEIGVDVEHLRSGRKAFDTVESIFSPQEVDQLFQLPEAQQEERFIDYWTLKEAYIKACGMGLYIPLDHFSYDVSQQGELSIDFHPDRDDDPDAWQFWQLRPSADFIVSIAIKCKKHYELSKWELVPLLHETVVGYPESHNALLFK